MSLAELFYAKHSRRVEDVYGLVAKIPRSRQRKKR
jgi:hypothetical protein